jgi:hypothetical protein
MFPLSTGSAVGFKLDSLSKLTETRASNSKMTLMHYLCKVQVLVTINEDIMSWYTILIFLFHFELQVLAEKSPALLDFHRDLVSVENASKVAIYFWHFMSNKLRSTSPCYHDLLVGFPFSKQSL